MEGVKVKGKGNVLEKICYVREGALKWKKVGIVF